MDKFLLKYEVNMNTLAIEPAKHSKGSIVYETDRQYLVKQTPFEIIKEACLAFGSTYEGRIESVMTKLGFHGKVPIPISIIGDIYVFPTHEPEDIFCSWIFKNHVEFVQPYRNRNRRQRSLIVFKGGRELVSELPVQLLFTQMDRTEVCKSYYLDSLKPEVKPRVEYNRRYWGIELKE